MYLKEKRKALSQHFKLLPPHSSCQTSLLLPILEGRMCLVKYVCSLANERIACFSSFFFFSLQVYLLIFFCTLLKKNSERKVREKCRLRAKEEKEKKVKVEIVYNVHTIAVIKKKKNSLITRRLCWICARSQSHIYVRDVYIHKKETAERSQNDKKKYFSFRFPPKST